MGPFLPYLLIPLSFFFRVDYFQRDVCPETGWDSTGIGDILRSSLRNPPEIH